MSYIELLYFNYIKKLISKHIEHKLYFNNKFQFNKYLKIMLFTTLEVEGCFLEIERIFSPIHSKLRKTCSTLLLKTSFITTVDFTFLSVLLKTIKNKKRFI